METGSTVILLNLENLYESLYDALNQVIFIRPQKICCHIMLWVYKFVVRLKAKWFLYNNVCSRLSILLKFEQSSWAQI